MSKNIFQIPYLLEGHFSQVKKLKRRGLGEQYLPGTPCPLPLAPIEMLYAIDTLYNN